jgi:hypothetical protein
MSLNSSKKAHVVSFSIEYSEIAKSEIFTGNRFMPDQYKLNGR